MKREDKRDEGVGSPDFSRHAQYVQDDGNTSTSVADKLCLDAKLWGPSCSAPSAHSITSEDPLIICIFVTPVDSLDEHRPPCCSYPLYFKETVPTNKTSCRATTTVNCVRSTLLLSADLGPGGTCRHHKHLPNPQWITTQPLYALRTHSIPTCTVPICDISPSLKKMPTPRRPRPTALRLCNSLAGELDEYVAPIEVDANNPNCEPSATQMKAAGDPGRYRNA